MLPLFRAQCRATLPRTFAGAALAARDCSPSEQSCINSCVATSTKASLCTATTVGTSLFARSCAASAPLSLALCSAIVDSVSSSRKYLRTTRRTTISARWAARSIELEVSSSLLQIQTVSSISHEHLVVPRMSGLRDVKRCYCPKCSQCVLPPHGFRDVASRTWRRHQAIWKSEAAAQAVGDAGAAATVPLPPYIPPPALFVPPAPPAFVFGPIQPALPSLFQEPFEDFGIMPDDLEGPNDQHLTSLDSEPEVVSRIRGQCSRRLLIVTNRN